MKPSAPVTRTLFVFNAMNLCYLASVPGSANTKLVRMSECQYSNIIESNDLSLGDSTDTHKKGQHSNMYAQPGIALNKRGNADANTRLVPYSDAAWPESENKTK